MNEGGCTGFSDLTIRRECLSGWFGDMLMQFCVGEFCAKIKLDVHHGVVKNKGGLRVGALSVFSASIMAGICGVVR